MRKSDLRRNHEPFDAAVLRYRAFLQRIIDAQRVVGAAADKQDIAESVLLRLCSHWERFVDEHIVDCVNRDSSALSSLYGVKIPAHPSRDLCHALLIGDRYTDFRSFGDLKGFSKKILPEESNPFLAVSTWRGNKIDEVLKIRNYLSHYSARSREALWRMYKAEYDMKRFVEPGRFLLANSARRLWAYFDAFVGASEEMRLWCAGD